MPLKGSFKSVVPKVSSHEGQCFMYIAFSDESPLGFRSENRAPLPVFRKYFMPPELLAIKRSTNPSASRSTSVGLLSLGIEHNMPLVVDVLHGRVVGLSLGFAQGRFVKVCADHVARSVSAV